MSRTEDLYKPALGKTQIPLLTLDHKWHQLFTQVEPDRTVRRLEKELNELLKEQSRIKGEVDKVRTLKKKLMKEIVDNAESSSSGHNEKAQKKAEENTRLINDCNDKLDGYREKIKLLPEKIDKVNTELMLRTMEICYDRIKKNEIEISETTQWVSAIRIELKKRLIQKQEQEMMNQALYSYMHDIFGAEVIELFDMKYKKD